MSNKMLQQAIIDAEALKEVALKNAESAVVEKYSRQIREAVDNMLEQDDEEEAFPHPTPDEVMPDIAGIEDEIPMAATDGEKLCPCPDEEEVIEIDFDDLQVLMKRRGSDTDAEDVAIADVGVEPADDMPLREAEEATEAVTEEVVDEEIDLSALFEEEQVEEQAEQKVEEVAEQETPAPVEQKIATAVGEMLSESKVLSKQKSKVLKENKELKQKQEKILKENKSLKENKEKLVDQNKNFRTLLEKLSHTLESVNLSNAKLVYTNQILGSTSLNERQKNKIVEAIGDADSVETAKAIFETLQSTVGSSSGDKPKSLSEVVTNNRTTMLKRTENKTSKDPYIDRMKKLAGI